MPCHHLNSIVLTAEEVGPFFLVMSHYCSLAVCVRERVDPFHDLIFKYFSWASADILVLGKDIGNHLARKNTVKRNSSRDYFL